MTFRSWVKLFPVLALVQIAGMALVARGAFAEAPAKVEICHVPPDDPSNVQILLVGSSAASAHIAQHGDVVMASASEASCGDQIDNDCDGLTDEADPDCACPEACLDVIDAWASHVTSTPHTFLTACHGPGDGGYTLPSTQVLSPPPDATDTILCVGQYCSTGGSITNCFAILDTTAFLNVPLTDSQTPACALAAGEVAEAITGQTCDLSGAN